MNSKKGYTLIELMLVIALLALTAGVTGDIIISLIRSYSKTQVANEIEQNANFVSLKLEKELRNAAKVVSASGNSVYFNDSQNNLICYNLSSGVMQRALDSTVGATSCNSNYVDLTNNDVVGGVTVTCPSGCFTQVGVSTKPYVIKLNMNFAQSGGSGTSFTGNVLIDNTVVIRGSY